MQSEDVRLVRLLLQVGEGAEDPNVCMLCMFNKQFLALHHSQIGPCCPCCLVSHLGLESHMLCLCQALPRGGALRVTQLKHLDMVGEQSGEQPVNQILYGILRCTVTLSIDVQKPLDHCAIQSSRLWPSCKRGRDRKASGRRAV